MFEIPRFVVKAGTIVVEQGEIRANSFGETLASSPAYDEDRVPDIKKWFESSYSVQFANYPMDFTNRRAP